MLNVNLTVCQASFVIEVHCTSMKFLAVLEKSFIEQEVK